MSKRIALIAAGVLTIAGIVFFYANGLVCGSRPSESNRTIRYLSAALEGYWTDHGTYPRDAESSDMLETNSTYDPKLYIASSAFLYRSLARARPKDAVVSGSDGRYCEFPSSMLAFDPQYKTYIVDHWGHSLGYSTIGLANPNSKEGNNPTFDLWSTGGGRGAGDKALWIKNW